MIRRAALRVLLAAGLGLGWKALPGRTPAIAGPDPIAVLEPVEIGGMTQWLLIRGQDRRAPVELVAEWFDAVEAPRGKQHEVVESSGHAPFLTGPARFTETVRTFAARMRGQ